MYRRLRRAVRIKEPPPLVDQFIGPHGDVHDRIFMSIIFATLPLQAAVGFAIVMSAGCAAIASLVSLGRARYEAVEQPGTT